MNPQINNVNMVIANTEYSFVVPVNTKYALIKTRQGLADLKLSYKSGESGTKYITIPATSTKTMTQMNASITGIILYFQSTISDVVEIESWS